MSGKRRILYLEISEELESILDDLLRAERMRRPGVKINRSDIVRAMIYEIADKEFKKRKGL